MNWALLIVQVVASVGAAVAAIAAWQAARAAKATASSAAEEIALQRESLSLTRQELETRELPRIVGVFRLDYSDNLFIDLSNYGGVATEVHIGRPAAVSPVTAHTDLHRDALSLINKEPLFVNGLDTLRPQETISCHVGRYVAEKLQDAWATQLRNEDPDQAGSTHWYRLTVTYNQGHIELSLLLDPTANNRIDPRL